VLIVLSQNRAERHRLFRDGLRTFSALKAAQLYEEAELHPSVVRLCINDIRRCCSGDRCESLQIRELHPSRRI